MIIPHEKLIPVLVLLVTAYLNELRSPKRLYNVAGLDAIPVIIEPVLALNALTHKRTHVMLFTELQINCVLENGHLVTRVHPEYATGCI